MPAASVEQGVDVVLLDGDVLVLRTVEEQNLAARLAQRLFGIAAFRRVADVDGLGEAVEALLQVAEQLEHLSDALAGDVLEGAGFEDRQDPRLNKRAVVL